MCDQFKLKLLYALTVVTLPSVPNRRTATSPLWSFSGASPLPATMCDQLEQKLLQVLAVVTLPSVSNQEDGRPHRSGSC